MEDKGEVMRQRFERRQEARIKELQKKKADIAAKSDENETVEAFNKAFSQEISEISDLLASLDESCPNKLVSGCSVSILYQDHGQDRMRLV